MRKILNDLLSILLLAVVNCYAAINGFVFFPLFFSDTPLYQGDLLQ